MEGSAMSSVTTAITNVGSIISSAMTVVTEQPLFMIGIGFAVLITGVGFVRRMIG